ncbi:MAG: tetratricopeptide repeat protein [Promethearchaeota archaeon]
MSQNYPHEEIYKTPKFGRKNFEHIILWMLNNNEECEWSDFTQKPLELRLSTLSKYLSLLKGKGYVDNYSRGHYKITSEGKNRFYEVSRTFKKKKKLSYPPDVIKRRRFYDHWIIWMVYNNSYCKWSDFLEEPLSINQSSLSKNMNLLIDKGFVIKENKEYRITQSGKLEYSRMLQGYDLDKQSILDEESKRIEEITKKVIKFFDINGIKDENIQFRFLNNVLRLDYTRVKSMLTKEEDFDKILLFLSINHPNQYPNYISIQDFSKTYGIKESKLEYYIDEIVENKIYPIKFFNINIPPDIYYYFQENERLEIMLRAITEDHITKFTYLNKLFSRSSDMHTTINNILEEICEILFHKDLKGPLRNFLFEYINYLAYKIEAEKDLIDTFDKIEGIIWREVQKYQPQFLDECEIFYYIDPVILETLEPHYKSKFKIPFNKAKNLMRNKEYLEALKVVNSTIDSNQKDLGLTILKAVILCFLEKNNQVIDLLREEIEISRNFRENKQFIPIFLLLAISYMTIGDIKSARGVVSKIMENYPDKALSYATKGLVDGYNLIYNIEPQGTDLNIVLAEIDKAISLDNVESNKARYYQLKSTILLRMNKCDDANEAINKALELISSEFDIYDSKINILLYSNQYDKLLNLLDDLIEIFPDNELYLKIKKAYVYKNLKNLEAGLAIINDLLQKYPNNTEILNTKVYYLQYLKRKEEALRTIKNLIEKEPNEAMFHDTYGEMLMSMQEYDKAAEEFINTVELAPYEWFTFQTYVKLGICYKELGDHEKAEEFLKKGKDLTNKCYCNYDIKNKWLKIADLFIIELEKLKVGV